MPDLDVAEPTDAAADTAPTRVFALILIVEAAVIGLLYAFGRYFG